MTQCGASDDTPDSAQWYQGMIFKYNVKNIRSNEIPKGKEEKSGPYKNYYYRKLKMSNLSPVLLNIRRWTLTRYFSGRREWKLHSCVRGMLLTKKNIWNESLKGENWENTKIKNQEFWGVATVVMVKRKS